MRKVQLKIFQGELTGSVEGEVNRFLATQDVFNILCVHSEQGGYVYILVFYYVGENLEELSNNMVYKTKIFQGPAALVEECVNAELKSVIYNDINVMKGWGDFLKVVMIIKCERA